ncbi:MAG: AAA family ATPase [Pseudomonadales bacterium]|nr:AAA family ATPase [Pseudomonadales bacterium]
MPLTDTMYNDYFGLNDTPFSIAPNPQFLYMSERHREALAHLLYGINSEGGFLLLTGEVGTGKTTVCRCLLEQIPEDVDTAFVLNPKQTANEMLATICDDLEIKYAQDASIKVLVDKLNNFLLLAHQQNRHTVVIIDEAQNLSIDVLEQLRLLTNLETNERKLLQIILLGQPELLTLLARPELRQLSQRVTARFHLEALSKHEITEYIQHRLDIAGAKGQLFPQTSIKKIYKITQGIPRLINLVCDRALLGTYVQNKLVVDPETVEKAAKEVLGDSQLKKTGRNISWLALSCIALAVGAYFSLTLLNSYMRANNQNTATDMTTAPTPSSPTANFQQPKSSPEPVDAPSLNTNSKSIPVNIEYVSGSAPPQDIINRTPSSANQLAQTSAAENVPATASTSSIKFTSPERLMGFTTGNAAFTELFKLWGTNVAVTEEFNACQLATDFGLQCLSKLGSLRDVVHLNRPALVGLGNNADNHSYFIITAITDNRITLRANNDDFNIRPKDFLQYWHGYYTLFWRAPPAFERAIEFGDSGASVDWLENQMSLIDQEPATALPDQPFSLKLENKVKRFQISVGLIPDGIVGAQTWIHINSIAGADIPFIQPSAPAGQPIEIH